MDIRRFTPDDSETVTAVVDLVNAAHRVDAPFLHPMTETVYAGYLRHGWDGEVPETWAAWDDDRVAGLVELHTSEWDNTHLCWTEVKVHPELRRGGRGTALLRFAEDRIRDLNRTSIGCSGWDDQVAIGFAARHELPRRGSAINRRQTLAKLDRGVLDQVYDEARSRASAYELVRLTGRTPPDLLDDVARMTAAINDAPLDDLEIEDEVFTGDRIAAYDRAQESRGHRMYRVLARHRETGELAGHTVVAVEAERPWIGDQHDTSVVRAHRGHRLGLLLKADMLRWLAEEEPALETIDTWNMESNDHMIGVNEVLGYEVLGRELQFQRDV